MEHIDVRILEREYRLAVAPEDKARLLEAVQLVDERMRTIRDAGRVAGLDRIAVMAALQLAHQLLGGGTIDPQAAQAAERVRQLAGGLDEALRRIEASG